MPTDTIAATATAPGTAAIAIVRLTGPDTNTVLDRIFSPASGAKPSELNGGTFAYGTVHLPDSPAERIDEAIVLIFRAPHSYTRLDLVEIQCHGGTRSAERILKAALSAGARPAEPGEFTKLAFLSGRIDLTQAEAVLDIIGARSDAAANAAQQQLRGSLSDSVQKTYDDTIMAATILESTLDFVEEELPADVTPDARRHISSAAGTLSELLKSEHSGHLMREGALVVIAGPPNVGKSTLLNSMLKHERAIVTPTPGTTRDTIEESYVLGGVPIRLRDTAGIRETDDHIESMGVSRSHDALADADYVLYMLLSSETPQDDDISRITHISSDKCLILLNKADLGTTDLCDSLAGYSQLRISLLNEIDIEQVCSKLSCMLDVQPAQEPTALVSQRHAALLREALVELTRADELLAEGGDDSHHLAAEHLRAAAHSLGRIAGLEYTDSLLSSIFSNFCIGK
jgi:tRNA modification GTPase